jgi:hypothetical protein
MKPKAALVKSQFVEPGHTWLAGDENKRGRLSKPAIAHLESLAAKGWDIDGYAVTSSATTAPVVTRVKTDVNAVAEIPNPTRDESTMTAWVGTKQIGMRTVCNNDRRSLTYCLCPQPKVWIDHETEAVVHFKEEV